MSKRLSTALLASLLLQTGCMIPLGLQPPPDAYEQWKKMGTSVHVQQVMAGLLECGFPWPWQRTNDLQSAWGPLWEASAVLADRCMESQDFVRDYGSKAQCQQGLAVQFRKYRSAAQIEALERACNPTTPIPQPSVEKRLNSPFCQKYHESTLCQSVMVPNSQSEGRTLGPVTIPQYPVVDRVEPQVQKNSNVQMNQLLRGTGSSR